jgi:hypothetical protein
MKNRCETSKLLRMRAQFCAVALLFLVGACATDRQLVDIAVKSPAGIEIGNEITLLNTATERVVVHMTQDGQVHLIAVTAGGDALHVVVSTRGIEKTKTIGTDRYGYYQNLAITDDAQGRLHLAIKNEHWVLDKGVWRLVGGNRCCLLTRAGDLVACATEVSGKELGTAAQWGIQPFGGAWGGIIIPYRIRPAKVVLGQAIEDGWSYRKILDYDLPYFVNLDNIGNAVLSSDASGRLHLFFEAYEGNSFHFRYATLALAADSQPDIEWRSPDGQSFKLISAQSESVNIGGGWFIPAAPPLPFAVDPQTGSALFAARRTSGFLSGWIDAVVEAYGKVLRQPVPIPVSTSRVMRLAPAGDDRFHALIAVDHSLIYATYRAGYWSGITRVGEFGTSNLFVIGNASIQLASDGRSRALVIWPKREGALVGRWIELSN